MTTEQKIALAEKNKDIPSSEIEQNILDTQREIKQMEREEKNLKQFVKKLKIILEVRNNNFFLKHYDR